MTDALSPELHKDSVCEIGLQLPDGTLIWPPDNWHGHEIITPAQRAEVVAAVGRAATNIGMDGSELLERYKWVTRSRTTYTVTESVVEAVNNFSDPVMVLEPERDDEFVLNGAVPDSVVSPSEGTEADLVDSG